MFLSNLSTFENIETENVLNWIQTIEAPILGNFISKSQIGAKP